MSDACYPQKQYVKYIPVGYVDTHNMVASYLFWIFGFSGAHRFYLGRPISGLIWLFTFGLLGIGWIVDLFLIPGMVRENNQRYQMGTTDYTLTWILFWFGGLFGLHRFYQGKIITGLIYLFTGGIIGLGWIYDLVTLNDQVDEVNIQNRQQFLHA